MIKKLRYKFLAVTMLCIGLLFAAILLALNFSMTYSSKRHGFEMLEAIADLPRQEAPGSRTGAAAGSEPAPDTPPDFGAAPDAQAGSGAIADAPAGSGKEQAPGSGKKGPSPSHRPGSYIDAFRTFSISYEKSGELLSVNYNKQTELSESDILQLGEKVWQASGDTPKERGRVQSRYLYLTRDCGTYWQIYFLDYSVEHSMTYQLFSLCLFVGLIGMVVLFAAVFILSGWMVRPVEKAFAQQKQFVADASHELKTPLTIITANAEVLSATLQENKWLSHILEQTQRMNTLIRNLLDLAKMDSAADFRNASAFAEFDLSRAVSSTALSFESLAFEAHKTYKMQIAEGLFLCGNEQAIRQLVTILLDNAFKYSDENGTITILLAPAKKSGVLSAERAEWLSGVSAHRTKKILMVHNTGKGIPPKEQAHIFERFYRSDSSRSRDTGGYGLGLSIAASIAYAHRAKISVQSDSETYTQITVIL